MDPLSISASILTVLAAAVSSAKVLKKAKNFSHLPDQLCALLNEISDLRAVLSVLDGLRKEDLSEELQGSIVRLLKRAKAAFDELEEVLKTTLVNTNDEQEYSPLRVSRMVWIRRQGCLKRLNQEIREIRSCMQTLLISMNSSFEQRMNFKIDRVTISQLNFTQSQERVEQQFENLQSTLTSTLKDLTRPKLPAPSQLEAPRGSGASDEESSNVDSVVEVETLRVWNSSHCPIGCGCTCHKASTFNLPAPLRFGFGALFVGYSGSAMNGVNPCSEKFCCRRGGSAIRATYYFPAWFFANVISFSYTQAFPDGPKISLKISRVRPKSSDVFLAATLGDIGWLQSLFMQRKASPFDVAAEDGQSVLQHSIDSWNMDTIVFLLKQGADPYHKHHHATSAADGFWRERHRLRAAGAKAADEPEEVRKILDDPDFTESLQLSTVHKIVFELANIDLDQYLSISTSEIDALDSTGKSPLHWAILRSDLDAVSTLLNRNANVDVQDLMRRTPLCYSVWVTQDVRFCQVVLAAGPRVDVRDIYGQTPLMYSCHSRSRSTIECCDILLSTNKIDVNAQRWDGYSALHLAAQHGSPAQIELLIDAGAEVDMESQADTTPLVIAIKASNHPVLSILLRRGAKLVRFHPDLETYSWAALDTAAARGDKRTMEIISQVDAEILDDDSRRTAREEVTATFEMRSQEEQLELNEVFTKMLRLLSRRNENERTGVEEDIHG
ncbi:ankyrin repeat-containing domain protein [Penicillium canescens]|nr:ankyrin repeat-containing domain protein [Penicillium canescens]